MHISRFSLSYAPHTSEVYNNIGLNSALKSLLQVSIDNFWKSRKLFVAKIQRLHFTIYTVVVIVVAPMAILVVVFIFHHC